MIEVKNLCKSYGEKCVFQNISLLLPTGQVTAFMGESGIGKTTLLRCIAGLEQPDSGTVNGMDGMKKTFVFQENRLIESISVLKNMTAVVPDTEKALYYLEQVGLIKEKNTKTAVLSGGMKRRLAIARALAKNGDFYYLDEPLRELDEATTQRMVQLLQAELKGKTGVLITHDPSHARALAQNRLYFEGKPMCCIKADGMNEP